MTTERIDVLAVMDRAAAAMQFERDDHKYHRPDIAGWWDRLLIDTNAARAAVAELIEALKAWDRWNYEVQSAKVTGGSVYSFQELTDMRTEAVRLTDASLARCGGA